MTWWDALLLVVGGFVAGVVNTMAGGGSALTVPLLVLAGLPGGQANGSNRVGILAASAAAAVSFRKAGVAGLEEIHRVLVPAVVGSIIGSVAIGAIGDTGFERVFGLLMIPIIFLTIFRRSAPRQRPPWSKPVTTLVFFAIGLYGGAFQAGVGLVLLSALTRSGYDLVRANNIKVLINLVVAACALPVFILGGDVVWGPASVLAAGFVTGGWTGARLAVRGGEKIIRVFMLVAATYLAGQLLGAW